MCVRIIICTKDEVPPERVRSRQAFTTDRKARWTPLFAAHEALPASDCGLAVMAEVMGNQKLAIIIE